MKPASKLLSAVFACALLFSGARVLEAQGLTGQVSGTVQDQSAAAVVGASVTVTNKESGQSRSVKTNSDGHFTIPELLPGRYSLTTEAPGFKRYEQREVVVSSTERVT